MNKPVIIQYTQEQLEKAFDKVKNPIDWKAPINTVLRNPSSEELELVREAIVHFTATIPLFKVKDKGIVRVVAAGYRAGPAGDC